jgi:hypothetical protein
MVNKSMEHKLRIREALDVRKIGSEVKPGVFALLPGTFQADLDYCDAETESWIWSIGRCYETSTIYASTTAEYYGKEGFECLWLR